MIHFTRGTSSLFKPDQLERVQCDPIEVMDALRELDGGDHSWWCAGTFEPGAKRSKDSWRGTGSLIPLDLDTESIKGSDGRSHKRLPSGEDWFQVMEAIRQGVLPWVLYAHTTPHGVRVVGIVSDPIRSVEDYAAVVDAMAEDMGGVVSATGFHLDLGSREPWRAMFAPGARVDGVARAIGMVDVLRPDAEAFDVAACLEAARTPQEPAEPAGGVRIGGMGQGTGAVSEARKAWLAANPMGATFTRGDCPVCGHHDCFQADAESRWFCYSTSCEADGPAGVGRTLPEGTRCGDAFDLAKHERGGLSDRELLIDDGFLDPPDSASDSPGVSGRSPLLLPGAWWDGAKNIEQSQNGFVAEVLQHMPEGSLYRRGDTLVSLDTDKAGLIRVEAPKMAHLIDANAWTYRWVKPKNQAPKPVYGVVPGGLAAQAAATAPMHDGVDPIDSVVRHPVLARAADDSFRICGEGYDQDARVYTLPHGLDLCDDMPAGECRAVLDDLVVDYPFVGEADKQNAIALMVTQVVRLSIDCAPLFYVGASQAGTGKTKLVCHTLTQAITGKPGNAATHKRSEEEVRKYLESVLLSGEAFACIDNVPTGRVLDSASLAAVLTMAQINMRILGETRESSVRNNLTLAITGNNTRLSHELARRTCPIVLRWGDDRPEARREFKHPHASTYARQRRSLVVSAIVSGATRWREVGCPEPIAMAPVGSFEHWRNVVGGIMEHGLGYDQVMANHVDFVGHSGDGSRDDADTLIDQVRVVHGIGAENARTFSTIYNIADSNSLFLDAMGGCRSEDSTRRSQYFRQAVLFGLRGTPTGTPYVMETEDRGATWFLGYNTCKASASVVGC